MCHLYGARVLPRSPAVVFAAVKVCKLGPDIDRPYSSFYLGRLSGLELESGPGAGIGLGI